MQGQRSTIDSFPETFEFDHGSSSSGPGIDQQLSWNNVLNPIESRLPDCLLPSHDTEFTFPNVSHDGRSLSGWCLGETSSSENTGNQVIHDEATKMEHAWPSLLNSCSGSGPRLDERQYEPTNILSLESVNLNLNSNQATDESLFLQNFSSTPQNMNLNDGYSADSGGRVVEGGLCPRMGKPGGSEAYSSGTGYSSGGSSGNVGFLAEESDGRPGCSLDGRRLACKRKTFEGVSGQLSLGGSPSCFHRSDNSLLQPLSQPYTVASSSSVTAAAAAAENPQLQPNSRLGVDISLGSSSHSQSATNAESSQRNFRMRINPARHDSPPSNMLSIGNSSRHSHTTPYQSSSRLLSFNPSIEPRPATASSSTPSPSPVMRTPSLPRTVHPAPRYNASNARVGSSSSSSVAPGERIPSREELNIRTIPRNMSEHPMLVPSAETRNLLQDPSRRLANGNMRIPRNVASTSRVGSSSGVHPSAAPTWLPLHNPSAQHSRRLSEVVRRSLFSSSGSDSGSQDPNLHPPHSLLPASAQEIVQPSGADPLGHHQPYHRSALRIDRQGDGIVGVPLSFRGLAAGRTRLMSEIRNALDLMRRGGEGVRFEDVFVYDQSMFIGVTDLHDRHREMRLDVDNMSYEELLALEERIGNVSTGLSEETIMKSLKQQKCTPFTIEVSSEIEPCCICQEEYIDGDDLGRLDCGHDFHTECIKQWLTQKNLCPICKTTGLAT